MSQVHRGSGPPSTLGWTTSHGEHASLSGVQRAHGLVTVVAHLERGILQRLARSACRYEVPSAHAEQHLMIRIVVRTRVRLRGDSCPSGQTRRDHAVVASALARRDELTVSNSLSESFVVLVGFAGTRPLLSGDDASGRTRHELLGSWSAALGLRACARDCRATQPHGAPRARDRVRPCLGRLSAVLQPSFSPLISRPSVVGISSMQAPEPPPTHSNPVQRSNIGFVAASSSSSSSSSLSLCTVPRADAQRRAHPSAPQPLGVLCDRQQTGRGA